MTLAYLVDGGLHDRPGLGTDLHEHCPAVREVYRQASAWTGAPVDRLLSWGPDPLTEYREVGAIRRSAVVLGLCDVLAEKGIRPDAVAGMSVGALTAAAIAGAVSRRELFELLARLREAPLVSGPPQGMATLFVPPGVDPEEFAGGFPDGVWVAVEIGPVHGGATRLVQLSGRQDALRKLAAQVADEEKLQLPPESFVAFHSPLRAHVRELLEPRIAAMDFHAPEIPLYGGMEPIRYETADQVREMVLRNQTDPVSLPRMLGRLGEQDVELSFLLGPAAADLYTGGVAHEVVQVENREHLAEAFEALHEFGRTSWTP
ncbi:acyltransferase domain-containing protein [Amycolatopsis acidicola]|uniref:[acyl-carrier-protein] S-malonyltransferase n=1 Tax=Amycolatopsis acidicola TaxID=2596893 RepID=A0A5N0VJW3_9PSEU|nr:acyltransferase domain-containing protein [Amycolatopsis acidicola]KAA9166495.1 acyltransferase domain-containing protein [Amycolatopsis acidicola]